MHRKLFVQILVIIMLTMLALSGSLAAAHAVQGAQAGPLLPARQAVLQEVPPAAPDLPGVLQWLVGGGGSILAVSWGLERMKWFQALSSETKDYTIFGAAAVVGCGALAIITYVPAVMLGAIAPYFAILASIFVTVFLAKVFHKADRLPTGGV